MLEFILMPHGTIFPRACVCCTGTAGPVLDTHRELHPYGRVYVCGACTKRLASVLGLIAGEEADAIAESVAKLANVERDLARSEEQRAELIAARNELSGRVDSLEEQLVTVADRARQLEEHIEARSRADRELVTAGPAPKRSRLRR